MRVSVTEVDVMLEPETDDERRLLERFKQNTRSPYWADYDSDGLRVSEICSGCLDSQETAYYKQFFAELLEVE